MCHKSAVQGRSCRIGEQLNIVVDEETHPNAGGPTRCKLASDVVKDNEGAGELVDPDPVVPTVNAN
jgi:hypothetical protein